MNPPSVLDKGVVVTGIGLPAVDNDAHKLIVDLTSLHWGAYLGWVKSKYVN